MSKMRQWTIFTIVAVLVVLVAGWMLLVKPEKSKVSSLKSQASTQDAANQVLLTQIESLQAEQKLLPQQQLTLAKFTTEVPDNAAEPTLIRQLTTAANGSGVDLISIAPSSPAAVTAPVTGTTPAPAAGTAATGATTSTTPTAPTTTLMQLPVALGVTGSYANLVSFFQSLEKLPRAMLVAGWSMCPIVATAASAGGASSGGGCAVPSVPTNKTPPTGTLGASLNATVFYSPPAAATTGLTPSTTTSTPAASTAAAS